MDFEAEIKKEFLMEARELVESSEELFLEFEQNTSNMQVIDNIFRLFHTLKGSSFTAGFSQLGSFTHKVESVLASIKDGELKIEENICDLLIRSNDILSSWVVALQHDLNYINEKSSDLEIEIEQYYITPDLPRANLQTFGFFADEAEDAETSKTPMQSNQVDSANLPQNNPNIDNKGVKILIIDDEKDIQDLIELYLEDFGFDIYKASDGQEGFEAYKKCEPDLILCDLKMPKLDGLECVKKIRQNDKTTPVVFVSGASDRDHIIKFIHLGALGFIEKPIIKDILLSMVRNGIYLKKMKDNLTKVSMLNFKIHMTCFQLIRAKDDIKKAKLEREMTILLDEIALLNNQIFELKIPEIA